MMILVTIDTIDELHQGSSNQVEKVAEICNMQYHLTQNKVVL